MLVTLQHPFNLTNQQQQQQQQPIKQSNLTSSTTESIQTSCATIQVDQNTTSSLDTLLDENSVEPPEQNLECDQNNLSSLEEEEEEEEEDIPYDEYEIESRPKVRTELLEHVRVEFQAITLDDHNSSNEQTSLVNTTDLTPAPGVRLSCDGCEYSLFQRIVVDSNQTSMVNHDDEETVLLSEPECHDLYYGPLETFIQSLHNIFPNLHDNNKNEIVLNFPTLEIKVPEDNIYSKEISLFDVDRLHIGARLPDRLLISLEKQPRLVHRFNVLATYVSELAENNHNMDENSGQVFVEDSDPTVEPILVDQEHDTEANEPEISQESGKDLPHHLDSAVSTAVDQPDMFLSTAAVEESSEIDAPTVVESTNDDPVEPTLIVTESSSADDLSSLNHAAFGNLTSEELDTATDDLTIIDHASAMQQNESHSLPEDTDQHYGGEIPTDIVHDENLDAMLEPSQEVDVRLDPVEPLQGCIKHNLPNGAESCSISERTVTGPDQLSEGEIDESMQEELEIQIVDADSTLVHDANDAPLNHEPALDVTASNHEANSSALPISNDDCISINLIPTSPNVGSKRSHEEVEDSVENFESSVGIPEPTLQNSDVKKARML